MIKFDTKLALTNYIATGKARETIYEIKVDETLQGKKTVYKYTNGTLVLLSENITTYTWRNSVNTFADITSATAPIGMDAVVVLADETRNGQPTQYYHDGYNWIYNGIYFKEALEVVTSERNTRGSDTISGTDFALPLKYVVGSGHLHIYYDEVALVAGVDFTEVGTAGTVSNKIQFMNTIPNQARLIYKRVISNKFDEQTGKRGKVDVYYFDTFTEAQNSPLLKDEGRVLYTFGHVTKNDGKGRYWILESTDKDFAYKNKSNSLFINRLISSMEKQPGEIIMIAGSEVAPPETVEMSGQIANRADFKRVWAWAVANGRVVTEAEVANNPGCFSSGDLTNTFRFPLAKDFIRAKESGRNVGSYQADSLQTHRHTSGSDGETIETPSTHYNVKGMTINGITYAGSNQTGIFNMNSSTTSVPLPSTSGGSVNISTETRPKNIMQKFFIKI